MRPRASRSSIQTPRASGCRGRAWLIVPLPVLSLVAILSIMPQAAAEPEVKAYVERNTVTLRRPFLLTLAITGEDIGTPEFPEVDGLNITNRPSTTSSSTHIEFSGAQSIMLKTRQFGYSVQATQTGKLTIPPIKVEVDGQTLQTQPILLTVVDRTQGQPAQQPQGNSPQASQPAADPSQRREPQSWEEVLFIESNVDKREVYKGESILLSLSLWRIRYPGIDVGLFRRSQMAYPESEGFYAIKLEPQEDIKERNGLTYQVTTFRVMLYPMGLGDLRIGAWHWEDAARSGFNQKTFNLDTPPIDIKVNSLPAPPPNFSGAVGRFSLQAQLISDHVVQGVPTVLEIRVKGRGNPEGIAAPQLPEIANVHIADPEKNTQEIEDAMGVSVEKTFRYTVTPLEAGELAIPAIEFCYFDPSKEVFETEQVEPFTVHVQPSSEDTRGHTLITDSRPAQTREVDVVGVDIRPIMTAAQGLRPRRGTSPALPVAVAGPPLAYAALALYMRRRRRFESDVGYARGYFAKSKGRKRLKNVASAENPASELFRATIGFVADKCDVPEAGLTSADARRLLQSHGAPQELIETFVKVVRACERAQYASAALSPEEIAALTQAAEQGMDQLDSLLGRRDGK